MAIIFTSRLKKIINLFLIINTRQIISKIKKTNDYLLGKLLPPQKNFKTKAIIIMLSPKIVFSIIKFGQIINILRLKKTKS